MVGDKVRFPNWLYLLSKLLLGYRYRPLKTNIVTPDVVLLHFSLNPLLNNNESNIVCL